MGVGSPFPCIPPWGPSTGTQGHSRSPERLGAGWGAVPPHRLQGLGLAPRWAGVVLVTPGTSAAPSIKDDDQVTSPMARLPPPASPLPLGRRTRSGVCGANCPGHQNNLGQIGCLCPSSPDQGAVDAARQSHVPSAPPCALVLCSSGGKVSANSVTHRLARSRPSPWPGEPPPSGGELDEDAALGAIREGPSEEVP